MLFLPLKLTMFVRIQNTFKNILYVLNHFGSVYGEDDVSFI